MINLKKTLHLIPLMLVLVTGSAQATELPDPPKTTQKEMWSLFLINNDHLITEDVDIELVPVGNQQADVRTVPFYLEMEAHAKADGIDLYLTSGYRNIATQTYLYNSALAKYQSYGYSYAKSLSMTALYYATPGGSEHHLGQAYDIVTPAFYNQGNGLTTAFAYTAAYSWLIEHCWDYGFILRYPQGRTADTGIGFEPWHYRFVGVEHAQYIRDHNLILEEYVALYEATYPELYRDTMSEYFYQFTRR